MPLPAPTGPAGATIDKMQVNGHYHSSRSSRDPRYESYDGSDYGSNASMGRKSAEPWTGELLTSATYGQFNYSNLSNGHASYDMGAHTQTAAPPPQQQPHDEVGLHLLYETAMTDAHAYTILSMSEVDTLKKEHERLASRLDATNRKLALESKVKEAAQNLHRLYLVGNAKGRPDTPQSPPSPRRSRGSLLGSKNRDSGPTSVPHSQTLHQAEDELATSVKKVDELHETYKTLLERKSEIEQRLLTHTAAVLADQSTKSKTVQSAALLHPHDRDLDDDDSGTYSPDEFDGIRDLLHNKQRQASRPGPDQTQQFLHIQARLEQLNSQLRGVIEDVSQSRGQKAEPDMALNDANEDIASRLDKRFTKLEYNIRALQQEHEHTVAHHVQAQDSAATTNNAVEEQLATLNHKLHNALLLSSDMPDMQTLRDPPEATGHGYQPQLQYLDDSIGSVGQMLQGTSKAAINAQKVSEYETTITGLWDIIEADGATRSGEDFSLPAFSSRVQNLHDRATAAAQQQDILRRQIQQQRELSGDADKKDQHIADLQSRHDQLAQAHEEVQDQLAEVIAKHAQAETEASRSRTELDNVGKEFEELQKAIDIRKQERDDMAKQLEARRVECEELAQQIEEHYAERDEMAKQIDSHGTERAGLMKQIESHSAERDGLMKQIESHSAERDGLARQLDEHKVNSHATEDLESEIVRLTTELTMAKAELDAASGTRSERAAKEAQAADAVRSKQLEQELQEMTAEFQELTRESVEMEKEREQLDALVDQLRERCETLETQLGDEKVRWIGAKSPAGPPAEGVRETTSLSVMRQEFKKMVRETRAEGFKALKAEQEERRKLQDEVRRLRQAKASGAAGESNGTTAART